MFPYFFPLVSPSLPPSLSHPSRWSQSTELIPSCSFALPLILTSRAIPAGSHRVVCRIRTGMASPRGGFSKHCSEKQPVLVWCSSQGGIEFLLQVFFRWDKQFSTRNQERLIFHLWQKHTLYGIMSLPIHQCLSPYCRL